MREQAHHHLKIWGDSVRAFESRLRLLGPEQVLARGYSITSDAETGKVLRDEAQVTSGQRLRTRLKKGEIRIKVEK